MDSQGRQSVSLNRHKDFFGVRECVKIFELDGHFVRLRNVNKKQGLPMNNFGALTEPAAPGKFCADRNFKQGEMYHAF